MMAPYVVTIANLVADQMCSEADLFYVFLSSKIVKFFTEETLIGCNRSIAHRTKVDL